jgi:hypothetical protein
MSWSPQSFAIGGRELILIGGSMHYFRIPPGEWEGEFRRMHSDGFNVVDTIIPWFIHEPEEGKFDFSALEAYFDLARKYSIYIVARPGPYICGEVDQGGFPRWLSGKNVRFRSNSDASREWSKHWYEGIMSFLARNQVSRGGPVIMVQIENEYGYPQYFGVDEKKEYLRFLWKTASAHGFDIPLMGNDIQFAEDMKDPVLSHIYGTVDAYFGDYQDLERILRRQRELNPQMPVGCAEYSLGDDVNATLRTMLGLGTAYLDLYMFRGGSQFHHAAKGYENSSYINGAPVEEGGYLNSQYYPLKLAAYFLRQFGSILAPAAAAPPAPAVDDPEVWVSQRNHAGQGFLFVRSDVRQVSERSLALDAASAQHLTYYDPQSGVPRVIPQYSTLLLRGGQSRLTALNLPLGKGSTLVYSTANLLGRYSYPERTWAVFYGRPGEQGEAAVSFAQKPSDLNPEAIWNEKEREAVYRLQFSDRDRIVALTLDVSLLVLSELRAQRAKELTIENGTALVVSDADEVMEEISQDKIALHFQLRRPLGQVTVLLPQEFASASADDIRVPVTKEAEAYQFDANIPVPAFDVPPGKIRILNSWTSFTSTLNTAMSQLISLPLKGIWKKGITHYAASFPAGGGALSLEFFTNDYKAVYINGQFVSEASNRGKQVLIGSRYFASQTTCTADIYYADTARPKEDLGLWRMDEEKGLRSVEWLAEASSIPVNTEWKIEFAESDQCPRVSESKIGLKIFEYTFPQPILAGGAAVWRVHMPWVPGLVYLNGHFMEHHEPGEQITESRDRPGIYLPPSMLKKEDNRLVLVTLAPPPSPLPLPIIQADADSIRKVATIVLAT